MAYVIPTKRSRAGRAAKALLQETEILFPALCQAALPTPTLDFTKLSFEEEIVPIPERRFEPGWARLSFKGITLHIETDYYVRPLTVDEMMGKAILQMKHRWVKFYTDRGEEPYNYDYEPPEPEEEEEEEEPDDEPDDESVEYFSD
jgi:hypothetical protein